MSLKATIEILVNFQNFRNIDLYDQGIYQLKATIQQVQDLQPIRSAQPYMILEDISQPKQAFVQINDKKNMFAGSSIQDMEFWSKAFLVRFCDEQVDLNDACLFRCEIDAFPSLDSAGYQFVVELMFLEMAQVKDIEYSELRPHMKSVAKFESKINNMLTGFKEYVPIMFDDIHFCLINATVHSLLIDFKFRQGLRSEINESQTFVKFLKRITKTCIFIFYESKVQQDLVDDFYAAYVMSLKTTYDEFTGYLKMVISDLVKDPQITKKYINLTRPLILPKRQNPIKDQQPIQINEVLISDYFNLKNSQDQEEMCSSLILEINSVSSTLFQMWYQFLEIFGSESKEILLDLKADYGFKIKSRWGESTLQTMVKDTEQSSQQSGLKNKEIAQKLRGNLSYLHIEPMCIEDLSLFPQAKIHPILFKEVYKWQESAPTQIQSSRGLHLIVFAHGYKGRSNDMRLWRNMFSIIYPDHIYLCSSCNENNTEQNILFMGQLLADEVKRWIKEWCPKNQFAKISFIGHSLGGLIIRAALPYLGMYRDKMWTFMTLASPHLGYLLSSSKVVDTGLWFIKKWKKCICLNQLTLSDAKNPVDSCIFKLSTMEVKKYDLQSLGISLDSYSPYESARIQRSESGNQESQNGRVHLKMIENLIGGVPMDRIQRLDVNYEILGNNLDNMIGRTAHIAFLDNTPLIRLVMNSFDDQFD